MIAKTPLCPDRIRQVPSGNFSWIDQRLVRDGYAARCSTDALALYLLLTVVGDGQGLSYYSERSLSALLKLDSEGFHAARATLVHAGLIAYRKPLYQVLALDQTSPPARPSAQLSGINAALANLLERAAR